MYIGAEDFTDYNVRSITFREDSNGKIFVYARAGASSTALYPKLVYYGRDGFRTTAVYDTGATALSAALGYQRFYLGIPSDAVPSDNDGWFQIGGPIEDVVLDASQSGTTGNMVVWKDATLTVSTAISATGATQFCDCVGIVMATATASTFDLYLIPKLSIGST